MNNITISAKVAARKAREHIRIPSTIIIPPYDIQVSVNEHIVQAYQRGMMGCAIKDKALFEQIEKYHHFYEYLGYTIRPIENYDLVGVLDWR